MPFGSILLRGLALLPLIAGFIPAADTGSDSASQARKELFAARFQDAAKLYSKLVRDDPGSGDAWYGLVRAHLELHQSSEAYAAAADALQKTPQTPGAQTAAGLVAWRKGELPEAEAFFRAALRISPDYPGALAGLATVVASLSKFRTARDLRLKAWSQSSDDPELMLIHANTLKGAEHLAAIEAVLPLLDPASELASSLRVHIANDRALGDMKLRRLVSPYQNGAVRLNRILDGPRRMRGIGVHVRLNGKQTVDLLLDTGASGIAIAPKVAERAGLRAISGEASEGKGIGDEKPQTAIAYLASEVRAGDVVFDNYPIAVFRSAQTADYDGLIGADVFRQFVVRIDFVNLAISLETRPRGDAEDSSEPVDSQAEPAPGFHRAFRFGNHLGLPTYVNGGRSVLFLIDSGAQSNLIDTELAKKVTSTTVVSRITARGIQGKVDKVSLADRITLVFAGFRQDNPSLLAIDMGKISDQMGATFGGLLGMPVLGNLAVTIDYREGTVRMDYKKP